MKKIVVFIIAFVGFLNVSFAQTTPADSLKQYVGEYKMQDGSPIEKYKVLIKDGFLFGETELSGSNKLLKQKELDTYLSTSTYGSIIIFLRDEKKKVNGLKISVQGNDIIGDKLEK